MKALTSIHTLPKDILKDILEVYCYTGEGIDGLFVDLRDILRDTPDRLLFLSVYKEDLKFTCVEAGISYQNVYREFLLALSWLHLVSKPYCLQGWKVLDLVISENLDVILHYQPATTIQIDDHRSNRFRYHLPFQSLQHPLLRPQ